MSGIESSKNSIAVEDEQFEVTSTDPDQRSHLPSQSKMPGGRWSAILGLGLLLLGLWGGWRWWQGNQMAAQQSAMAGRPMGIPVKLSIAQTSLVKESTEYVGTLESQRSVLVRPEIVGRVSAILVQPGDRVRAGDPLIQLKPDKREAELASVLAAVNSARANRSNSQAQLQATQADRIAKVAEMDLQNEEYRRISVLVKEGALPQQRLDQVERDRRRAASELRAIDQRIQAAKASLSESEAGLQQAQANANLATEELSDTTVVAPFNGTVGDIPIRLGQVVESSDTLTTVTQNNTLDLNISVPLEKAPDLKLGQRVELVSTQGNVIYAGRISFISPQANTRAQSILAKASFDNAQGKLRDGQFVRARIIWSERPGILVPAAAISRLGGATFVFVAQPPDKNAPQPPSPAMPPGQAASPPALVAKQKPVKLGSIQGNSYQILEGLKPGEQIVTSGVLNLIDGAPIMPQTK